MHRLFVAIRPPEAVREQLLDLMEGMPGMRWQDDDQLHLTLRFIGEVERPVAEDLTAALQHIRFDSFPIALDGVGKFERHRNGVLWAGVRPKEQLKALAAKVERACQSAGLDARAARLPSAHHAGALEGPSAKAGRLSGTIWRPDLGPMGSPRNSSSTKATSAAKARITKRSRGFRSGDGLSKCSHRLIGQFPANAREIRWLRRALQSSSWPARSADAPCDDCAGLWHRAWGCRSIQRPDNRCTLPSYTDPVSDAAVPCSLRADCGARIVVCAEQA